MSLFSNPAGLVNFFQDSTLSRSLSQPYLLEERLPPEQRSYKALKTNIAMLAAGLTRDALSYQHLQPSEVKPWIIERLKTLAEQAAAKTEQGVEEASDLPQQGKRQRKLGVRINRIAAPVIDQVLEAHQSQRSSSLARIALPRPLSYSSSSSSPVSTLRTDSSSLSSASSSSIYEAHKDELLDIINKKHVNLPELMQKMIAYPEMNGERQTIDDKIYNLDELARGLATSMPLSHEKKEKVRDTLETTIQVIRWQHTKFIHLFRDLPSEKSSINQCLEAIGDCLVEGIPNKELIVESVAIFALGVVAYPERSANKDYKMFIKNLPHIIVAMSYGADFVDTSSDWDPESPSTTPSAALLVQSQAPRAIASRNKKTKAKCVIL